MSGRVGPAAPGASEGIGLGALQSEMMAQLRRLNTAEGDELGREVERTRAVAALAGAVVESANVMLAAAKAQDSFVDGRSSLPKALTS